MTDDREYDAAEVARVMSLVLDTADPSHSAEKRDEAAEAALELDAHAAGAIAIGYLRAVLDGISVQLGPDAAAMLMDQLASMSFGALGDSGGDT